MSRLIARRTVNFAQCDLVCKCLTGGSRSRKGSKGDFADMLPPLVVEVPPSRQDPGDREQRDWIEFVIKQDGRAVTLQVSPHSFFLTRARTLISPVSLSFWRMSVSPRIRAC